MTMPYKTPLRIAGFLTWIAGFVDAVGYISLGHIYTANMSGNSVSIGIEAVAQNWPEALRRLCPVIGYVIGLLFCRSLIQFGARERIRSIASVALACEIGLLLPVYLAGVPTRQAAAGVSFLYIALLALAMGVQNAALTHFSSVTVHTGFVTGTLVKFAEELTKYLTWALDHLRRPHGSLVYVLVNSPRQRPFLVAFWLAAIWVTYVAGAACGALSQGRFKLRSLIIPIVSLAVLVTIDLRRPLAMGEEIEQSKLYS